MVAGFGDDRATVGMADEDRRSFLLVKCSLSNSHVVGMRDRWILNNAHLVARPPEDLIQGLPTRSVDKTAMDENDVCHEILLPSRLNVLAGLRRGQLEVNGETV
jgi:hypothetical protein